MKTAPLPLRGHPLLGTFLRGWILLASLLGCQGRSGGTMPPEKFRFQPVGGRMAACVQVQFFTFGSARAWTCPTEVSYLAGPAGPAGTGAVSLARAQMAAASAADQAAHEVLQRGARGQDPEASCRAFYQGLLGALTPRVPGAQVAPCSAATLRTATFFP